MQTNFSMQVLQREKSQHTPPDSKTKKRQTRNPKSRLRHAKEREVHLVRECPEITSLREPHVLWYQRRVHGDGVDDDLLFYDWLEGRRHRVFFVLQLLCFSHIYLVWF
eukprot:Trichotokara_eunicae@DN3065_c0_g1_i1.p1